MTFKELAKAENPNLEGWEILIDCPEDFGLEEKTECINDCEKCWNREIPMTAKEKIEVTIKEHDDVITNVINKSHYESGYNQGLNDAWELADKIRTLDMNTCEELFGYISLVNIVKNFTPQEAIAKLKDYEEAQIEVGDVVKVNGRAIVVNAIRLDCVLGLDRLGEFYEVDIDKCEKTGKHLDLASILEQIGE